MCALGQMLEEKGIATVAIGLVRHHMELTRGPRGLWVPFPLGRPLGEPGDAAFQGRVLRAALALLGRAGPGPVLEDFPEDAPGHGARDPWDAPIPPPSSTPPVSPAAWAAALAGEMALLRPWWTRAQARYGRSTVGLSSQPPEAWPEYAAAFLSGDLPAPPAGIASPALALRYVADDLKAWYSEAAQADGAAPSMDRINAWLYRETVAGGLLVALRAHGATSEHSGFQTVATRFLVPVPWLPAVAP
ncbi:MAG: hypothetical protein ACT4P9_03615 [Betaproteobacteria bacterium]